MHRFIALLVVIVLCSTKLWGQVEFKGQISDSTSRKGLDMVMVALLKTDSVTIVSTAFTDSLGRFALKATMGTYVVKADLLGYYAKTMRVELNAQTQPLNIELASKAQQLGEAEILSEKPVIRNVAGKIIFDVSKTVSDGAETAMESLQKIPGVMVTQDGAVSVRGKSGVKILVDGKPNPMAETNPEQFLKSIPAKNIETIEVNTVGSAKYDAEGKGVVINIKLRKGRLEGLNGSVSAGVGTLFNKYNSSGNINYKKGKLNVFGNAYYSREKKWSWGWDERKLGEGDSVSYINQYTDGTNRSQSIFGKAGIEYSPDKKHSITYTADVSNWRWWQDYWGHGDIRNAFNEVVTTTAPGGLRRNSGLNITNSINYQQTFDSTDKMWSVDVAYTLDRSNGFGESYFHTYDTAGIELPFSYFNRKTKTKGQTHNVLLQSDLVLPLKREGWKIETGIKQEVSIYDNTADIFDAASGQDVKDKLQSSRFRYIESISAAYVEQTGEVDAFSYTAGLRWEHTYINSATAAVSQNYPSIFPFLTLGYDITDEHSLMLSYDRSIERPGFWMLNNVVRYFSPFSVWMGNPSIQPAFTNSVSLEYNGAVKQQSFTIGGSFYHTGGTFQSITQIDSNRVSYSRYENAGTEIGARCFISGNFKITKWWDLSFEASYDHNWFDYLYKGERRKNSGYVLSCWGSTTFKFWKNASFSIWGWGNSGDIGAQSNSTPAGGIVASLKKKFFKDQFIVTLSCRDVFNTQKWGSKINSPGFEQRTLSQVESRIAYLTLTYQFGKQTMSPETKTKKSSRVGGGGGGN